MESGQRQRSTIFFCSKTEGLLTPGIVLPPEKQGEPVSFLGRKTENAEAECGLRPIITVRNRRFCR
ncbi:hypothetical protein CL3_33490 [butyrate-producing bacterium SM4/1]|nr:hypothetical protein CL3_33490 [butyrate-producing bacterium SM4/1]